jgi:hypothetical protein
VHKTANILDKMPKSVQGKAKQLIHEMYLAPTRKAALAAYDQFISSYQANYPKATECLKKDKEWLFTFYNSLAPALAPFAHHQSHRINLGPFGFARKTLAPTEWIATHPQSRYRCSVCRREELLEQAA